MKRKIVSLILLTVITVFYISACDTGNDQDLVATQISIQQTSLMQTVQAGITQTLMAKPTVTQPPMPSPVLLSPTPDVPIPPLPPTSQSQPPLQKPCNLANFVADVTVPDNTKIDPGAAFKKTWRLMNAGTCTWTSEYLVAFIAGVKMSTSDTSVLTTGSVPPGGSVDVTVDLKAPTATGRYNAYYRLKAADGTFFGINVEGGTFYVQILVGGTGTPGTPTPTVTGTPPTSTPSPTAQTETATAGPSRTPTGTKTTAPVVPTVTKTTAPVVPTATKTTAPVVPTVTNTTAPVVPTATNTTAPVVPTNTEVPSATPTQS